MRNFENFPFSALKNQTNKGESQNSPSLITEQYV